MLGDALESRGASPTGPRTADPRAAGHRTSGAARLAPLHGAGLLLVAARLWGRLGATPSWPSPSCSSPPTCSRRDGRDARDLRRPGDAAARPPRSRTSARSGRTASSAWPAAGPSPLIPDMAMRSGSTTPAATTCRSSSRYDSLWRRAVQDGGPTESRRTPRCSPPRSLPGAAPAERHRRRPGPGRAPVRTLPLAYRGPDARDLPPAGRAAARRRRRRPAGRAGRGRRARRRAGPGLRRAPDARHRRGAARAAAGARPRPGRRRAHRALRARARRRRGHRPPRERARADRRAVPGLDGAAGRPGGATCTAWTGCCAGSRCRPGATRSSCATSPPRGGPGGSSAWWRCSAWARPSCSAGAQPDHGGRR